MIKKIVICENSKNMKPFHTKLFTIGLYIQPRNTSSKHGRVGTPSMHHVNREALFTGLTDLSLVFALTYYLLKSNVFTLCYSLLFCLLS